MLQNRFSVTADRAHLALGLAAAPAVQRSGQLLVEAAQIAVFADQAVAEAAVGVFGEHRRGAAAAVSQGIRKIPNQNGIQPLFKQHHISRPQF